MSKFANELYHLMEKSYMEDVEPIQLKFTNRVYKKYGKEFNKKYDFISGKNLDYIAEQLQATNLGELDKVASSTQSSLLSSLKEFDELSKEELAPMMYVPEETRPESLTFIQSSVVNPIYLKHSTGNISLIILFPK